MPIDACMHACMYSRTTVDVWMHGCGCMHGCLYMHASHCMHACMHACVPGGGYLWMMAGWGVLNSRDRKGLKPRGRDDRFCTERVQQRDVYTIHRNPYNVGLTVHILLAFLLISRIADRRRDRRDINNPTNKETELHKRQKRHLDTYTANAYIYPA